MRSGGATALFAAGMNQLAIKHLAAGDLIATSSKLGSITST
ncbi:hypothetical protein GQ600_1032 [Phytophthora cactorum]|nr:hypothetical protein GQ600_1032 [Phytophthora cactorum]